MKLTCSHPAPVLQDSPGTRYVRRVFGLDEPPPRLVIARNVEISPGVGRIVLFQGPSGSGKSSLLRRAARRTPGAVALGPTVPAGDRTLIDALGLPPDEALRRLASCGLGEAALMLRRPSRLSEGQRYRFALALALSSGAKLIVADEFASTLDRPAARVLARSVRKIADREGVGFLLATAHADLVADLAPDEVVRCRFCSDVEVTRGPFGRARVFPASSTSPRVPDRTGRTSLGGIIAGRGSGRSAACSCSGTGRSPSASASSASAPCPTPRAIARSACPAS